MIKKESEEVKKKEYRKREREREKACEKKEIIDLT